MYQRVQIHKNIDLSANSIKLKVDILELNSSKPIVSEINYSHQREAEAARRQENLDRRTYGSNTRGIKRTGKHLVY